MSLLYADTSAVISAFLADEPDRDKLTELLLSGEHKVVTSELIRTDFARVITAASKQGRLTGRDDFLARLDSDSGSGVIALLPLAPQRNFSDSSPQSFTSHPERDPSRGRAARTCRNWPANRSRWSPATGARPRRPGRTVSRSAEAG